MLDLGIMSYESNQRCTIYVPFSFFFFTTHTHSTTRSEQYRWRQNNRDMYSRSSKSISDPETRRIWSLCCIAHPSWAWLLGHSHRETKWKPGSSSLLKGWSVQVHAMKLMWIGRRHCYSFRTWRCEISNCRQTALTSAKSWSNVHVPVSSKESQFRIYTPSTSNP